MNCGNCGKPLEPGNGTCPHCGALNIGFDEEIKVPHGEASAVNLGLPDDVEEFVDIDVEENNSDETEDVSNTAIIPEITHKKEEEEEENIYGEDVEAKEEALNQKPEGVDINIPEASAPTEPIGNITGIDEVKEESSTVGEINVGEGIEPRNKLSKVILTLKRTKTVPTKLFVIMITVFLILGIITGKLVFSKNVCTVPKQTSLGNTSNKIKTNGKKSEVRIGSFVYKVPDDCLYDHRDNGLYLYAKDAAWRVYIQEKAGLYTDLANSQKSLIESVKALGYDASSVSEKKFEDKTFVILNTTKNLQNRLAAYTDAGNDKLFFVEIVTSTNSFGEDILPKVANILSDAKETDEKITKMEEVPISDFSDVVIKAGQEYIQVKQAEIEKEKQLKQKEEENKKAN